MGVMQIGVFIFKSLRLIATAPFIGWGWLLVGTVDVALGELAFLGTVHFVAVLCLHLANEVEVEIECVALLIDQELLLGIWNHHFLQMSTRNHLGHVFIQLLILSEVVLVPHSFSWLFVYVPVSVYTYLAPLALPVPCCFLRSPQ